MKTEAEIRRHLDELRYALTAHCGCAAERHAFECMQGRLMIQSTIHTVEWILDEGNHDAFVAAFAAIVQAQREGRSS